MADQVYSVVVVVFHADQNFRRGRRHSGLELLIERMAQASRKRIGAWKRETRWMP